MMSRLVIVLFVSLKTAPTFSVNKESSPNSSNAFDQSIFFLKKLLSLCQLVGVCTRARAHTHTQNVTHLVTYCTLACQTEISQMAILDSIKT